LLRSGRTAAVAAGLAAGLAAVLVATAALAPSASGSPVLAAPADEPTAEWTFLIYGVLDTQNVADVLEQDLASLTGLPDVDDVNVVALVDMPEQNEPGYPSQPLPGLAPFTTAKLLVLDDGKWNEIRDLGEISMGRPDVLASFIDEAVDRFPAQKYGITLMDHGGGRYGGYWDSGEPGTRNLTIPDMRTGLLQGIQDSGIGRFDVLFHAACLMSNYETASALAPTAKVMAGSEELMFANPLVADGLTPLAEDADGEEVANSLVDAYGGYLDELAQEPGGQQIRDLAAMSVVDSDAMATLDAAMQSFADAAVAHMDEIAVPVARARADALEFVVGLQDSDDVPWDLVDLGDFLRHLTDVPDDVAVARDAAYTALQGAITHQLLGQGTQQATGLNVYLPTAESAAYAADYFAPGVAPQGWAEFVRAFLEVGTSQPSNEPGGGVAFASQQATVVSADPSGIKIAGQLVSGDSSQVTESETQIYTRIGDRDGALGMVLPAYLDAGGEGQVQGVWDYSLTVLTDGQKQVAGTSVYQAQSGGLLGTLLAQYTSPEGDVSDVAIRLLLSSQGEIQSVQVVDVSNGGQSAGGVTLDVGGRLTPYVFALESGSFSRELSSQSIAVSEALEVAFSRLDTGTPFSMGVVVSDVAGNSDGAFLQEQVR
jgi:Clostripain family